MYCKKAVATSPPFCYALHYKYSTFEEPKQGVSEKLIATFNELCITNEKIGTYPFKTDFNPAERNFVLQFSLTKNFSNKLLTNHRKCGNRINTKKEARFPLGSRKSRRYFTARRTRTICCGQHVLPFPASGNPSAKQRSARAPKGELPRLYYRGPL